MGGGKGCYAGQPLSFFCAKCRKSIAFRRSDWSGYAGDNWKTTGKKRKQLSAGGNYRHWPDHAYQYECLDCKHVGWSRHPQVERRYKKEHASGE